MKVNWIPLLLLMVALISCQRAKEKGRDVLDASIAKAKKKGISTFQSGAKAVANGLTTTRKSSFQACFGKRDSLHVQEIDGLLVDIPPGFYQRFLTYKADKNLILTFIETLPTQRPDYSSETGTITDSSEMNKRLLHFDTAFPAVRKQLDFFCKVRQCSTLTYYQCNRFPFVHIMAFDKETGTVYHFSENTEINRTLWLSAKKIPRSTLKLLKLLCLCHLVTANRSCRRNDKINLKITKISSLKSFKVSY